MVLAFAVLGLVIGDIHYLLVVVTIRALSLCVSISSGVDEIVCIQTRVCLIRVWLFSVTCSSEHKYPFPLWRSFTGREFPLSFFHPTDHFHIAHSRLPGSMGKWMGITQRIETTEEKQHWLQPPPCVYWELSSLQVAELTHLNLITLRFFCRPSGTGDNEWQNWPGTTKESDWKGWGNPQVKQSKTGLDSITSCSLISSIPGYWAEQPHRQTACLQPPQRSFANSFLHCFCNDVSLKLSLWSSQMRLRCCWHPVRMTGMV